MKTKIKEVMIFEPVASKLLNYEWETPKISYSVFKLVNFVLEQKRFFGIEKSKLFKKYGEADGENIKIKEENKDIFQKEIDELLSVNVELPEIEFTMDDVLKVTYIESNEVAEREEKLTPLDMYRIETFLNHAQKCDFQDKNN